MNYYSEDLGKLIGLGNGLNYISMHKPESFMRNLDYMAFLGEENKSKLSENIGYDFLQPFYNLKKQISTSNESLISDLTLYSWREARFAAIFSIFNPQPLFKKYLQASLEMYPQNKFIMELAIAHIDRNYSIEQEKFLESIYIIGGCLDVMPTQVMPLRVDLSDEAVFKEEANNFKIYYQKNGTNMALQKLKELKIFYYLQPYHDWVNNGCLP